MIICFWAGNVNARTHIPNERKTLDKQMQTCYNIQALRSAAEYRGVEQLEACRAHNPEVVGSSPASATIKTTDFAVVFLCFYNF